jgi:flagellar protein FlaC
MGKKDNDSAEQPDGENKKKSEETKKEEKNENDEEKKEETEKLRKVIKVDEQNKDEEKKEDGEDQDKKEDKSIKTDSKSTEGIEGLEQKRAILQSIKDFDFQIKKNQEEITGINKKVDSVSKDLDDLVSLYEIVSEQMNPFVGLSKVTKKRIDALENFTREIEILKERTGELESFAERSGAKLKSIAEGKVKADTIDTDELLKDTEKDMTDKTVDNSDLKDDITDESNKVEEEKKAEIEKKVLEEPEFEDEEIDHSQKIWNGFSDYELDRIIEMSLDNMPINDRLNMVIDDFIEKLKRLE